MASSARKNLCAALKIDCFAPKPVPEKEEAPDLEAGGDEELDYKQETTTPVAEPRPPASLRRSPSDEPYLEPRDDDEPTNALVKVARSSTALPAVRKSKFYGSFVLNRRVVLHAIDATPARWRGGAGSSPLDGAGTAASSPRNAPDALVDFHTGRRAKGRRGAASLSSRARRSRSAGRSWQKRGAARRCRSTTSIC